MTAPIISPGWEPAAERMLSMPAPQRLRGMGPTPSPQLTLRPKSSADNLDYGLSPQQWLAGTTDYVASVSATVLTGTGTATDLTVLMSFIVSGVPVLFLGGGEPGTVQTLQVTVRTQQGRIWSSPVSIAIYDTISATQPNIVPTLTDGTPIPPNAIRLPGGDILSIGAAVTSESQSVLLLHDGSPLLNSSTTTTAYLSDLILPSGDRLLDTTGDPLGIDAVDVTTEVFGPLALTSRTTRTDILLIA